MNYYVYITDLLHYILLFRTTSVSVSNLNTSEFCSFRILVVLDLLHSFPPKPL